MKYFLFIIPLFFISFLSSSTSLVNAQVQCTIARPGVTCLNPDGTIRPGTEDGADDPGVGNSEIQDRGAGKIENPLKIDSVEDLLAAILSAIVQIAIPFLVLAVMWVGFLFVAARGNPSKLAEARQALFYTLLGALIVLGAKTLSIILSGTIKQLTDGTGN